MAADAVAELEQDAAEQGAPAAAAAATPESGASGAGKGAGKASAAKAGAAAAGAAAKQPKAKKGGKDDKQAKKSAATEPDGDGPSVAGHPRAARGVARAKGWGGLLGFLIGGYLSLPTNTLAGAGLRALAAGVVCYIVVWAGAVFVWRRLVMLEIKNREQQMYDALAGKSRRELPAPAGEHPDGHRQAGARASS